MGQRGRAALVAAVVMVGAGCTVSTTSSTAVAPATPATAPATVAAPVGPVAPITGQLVSAGGQPIAGLPVTLDENRGVATTITGILGAVFSLGLACLAGDPICHSPGSAQTTTDASGRFTFSPAQIAKARQSSNGVIVAAGDTAHGALTVKVDPGPDGDLGTLPFWDPHTTATRSANSLDLRYSAPPGANGRTVLSGTLLDGRSSSANDTALGSFSSEGTSGEAMIDPRSMEDQGGRVVLTAGFSRPRAGQEPRIDWTAPIQGLVGAGRPLSRGAGCHLVGRPDPPVCPLTDGDLVTPANPPSCSTSCATAAIVDLGRAVPDILVAVRPSAGYRIEGSTDRVTYTDLIPSPSTAAWNATLATSRAPVRYLRITGAEGDPLAATEVSVWPVTGATPTIGAPAAVPLVPGAAGTRPVSSPPAAGAGGSGRAGRTGGPGKGIEAVAVIALFAVTLALGVVLGRRRRVA